MCAVALKCPFTGTKWLSPNHEKHSQTIVPLHQTTVYSWKYALGQVTFSWHPPNSDWSFGLPDGEEWIITPENAVPLLESPISLMCMLVNNWHESFYKYFQCCIWIHFIIHMRPTFMFYIFNKSPENSFGPTFGTLAFLVIATILWSRQPMGTDIALKQISAALVKIWSIQVNVTDQTLLLCTMVGWVINCIILQALVTV